MKLKKSIKIFLGILGIIIAIILAYIGYVYFSYSRIADDVPVEINQRTKGKKVAIDKEYKITTFNIGYGSYTPDYTFFMDGGKQSKAVSKESVIENISGVIDTTKKRQPDFALFQEVDKNATRSRGVDEVAQIKQQFNDYSSVFATNYDSAFLMYPILDPIGKSTSGILTLSNNDIETSTRYSLPIETNLNKFFDLDRAFTVSKIPAKNGKYLMLYNVHLSAYIKDQKIQKEQVHKLFDHMENEYKKGNYVVGGGDFNHDLLDSSTETFKNDTTEEYTWLQPFPKQELPKDLQVATLSEMKIPIPSVRNLDKPYKKGESFVALIDGFIVSDNVENVSGTVIDAEFNNSDHNPVEMTFKLKP
ncbi:hydrolase [Enterococcus plantarum]|uniref:endonuclease/exonuclease/phosphatase family protein n=1 Tax=Enterococcus plantarum TaxID=1077675 RepID=UPI00084D4D05|nr:hydrolase [Enterococcus plantarum]MBO0422522.1 hydrolase [Enterococcus plantarum]OEG08903.1 hydrolase [Enterococcus plantarum]